MALGVCSRYFERRRGDVCSYESQVGQMNCKGYHDATRPGSEVDDQRRVFRGIAGELDDSFNKELSFGSGYQDVGCNNELETVELLMTCYVLQGLARDASRYEFQVRRIVGVGNLAGRTDEQLSAVDAKDVAEQGSSGWSFIGDRGCFKKRGSFCNHFGYGRQGAVSLKFAEGRTVNNKH